MCIRETEVNQLAKTLKWPKALIWLSRVPYAMVLLAKYSGSRLLVLSVIVLYNLENDEHDAERSFIAVEEGTMSLIQLSLCKCKLELVYYFWFFFFFFKDPMKSSKGSWKLEKTKQNPNQTKQSGGVNVQCAWTGPISVQAPGHWLRKKYWEKSIN